MDRQEAVAALRARIAAFDYKAVKTVVLANPDDGYRLFYEALLGDCDEQYVARLRHHERCVSAVCSDETEDAHMAGLEHFLTAVSSHDRLVETPFILKFLFEEDLVSERAIIAWHRRVGPNDIGSTVAAAAKIRVIAEPVVSWIAETDSSDSESS
jgi:eIF4-gamma/eIF5/eIF2-epsilon